MFTWYWLAAISLPYYRYVCKFSLDKLVCFAKKVWGVHETGKSKEEVALECIDAIENFIKECGIVTILKELDATEDMLPLIANSTVLLPSVYKALTAGFPYSWSILIRPRPIPETSIKFEP